MSTTYRVEVLTQGSGRTLYAYTDYPEQAADAVLRMLGGEPRALTTDIELLDIVTTVCVATGSTEIRLTVASDFTERQSWEDAPTEARRG
jgi:hypothetical protein